MTASKVKRVNVSDLSKGLIVEDQRYFTTPVIRSRSYSGMCSIGMGIGSPRIQTRRSWGRLLIRLDSPYCLDNSSCIMHHGGSRLIEQITGIYCVRERLSRFLQSLHGCWFCGSSASCRNRCCHTTDGLLTGTFTRAPGSARAFLQMDGAWSPCNPPSINS